MTTNTNAALAEYANPLNWDADANGVRRIWREPGSDTPDAYNGFEMARAALTTAAAVPPEGVVMVPVELANRVQESLGEFLMDHGWSQRDMDTSDDFGAVLLAAAPKAEPVPAGEYPPLPAPFIGVQDRPWGGHAEVIRSAIGEDGVVSCYTEDQMRTYVDADRAMRAQAAPAVVTGPSDEAIEDFLASRMSAEGRIPMIRTIREALTHFVAPTTQAAPQPAVQQGDALPREDFAWLVVQEACETEPADEDDPECIRILRRDLKSAVLSAFLRHDAAHPAAPVALIYEQHHAIRQGHEISSSDAYFDARPQIDNNDSRKVFAAGFVRGWDAARSQAKKGGAW